MSLAGSWLVFPAILATLCVGCGSLVAAALGRPVPLGLVAPLGLAAIIVAGQFLVISDSTAELATPAIVLAALAGLVLRVRRAGLGDAPPPDDRASRAWLAGALAVVFGVYAAPVVGSGEATFAGYIKLDDTATWLAITDHLLVHGRDLGGLEPSTYEATLALNLGEGYPAGVFVPFGVAAALTGIDLAWLIQPYIAVLATLACSALWAVGRRLAGARWAALAAAAGTLSALLFGYALWGGVKEVALAALIAALVGVLATLERAGASTPALARALVPAALVTAAAIAVASAGALVWLLPGLGWAAFIVVRRLGAPRGLAVAGGFALIALALSVPVLVSGGLLPPTSSPLDDPGARGNLAGALDPAQIAGVWLGGDFRFDPGAEVVTYALVAVVLAAALAGVRHAARAGAPAMAVLVAGAIASAGALLALGSPWIAGKGLAIASVTVPFAAVLGCGAVSRAGARALGAGIAAAIVAAIAASNALAIRDASLAPRGQLAELARIGEAIAGEGPTLLTEYSPYGARHFLREAAPESVSDLRRRPIPLRGGGQVAKGGSADTDALDPGALAAYRTLVVRRSPVRSRPPAAYELVDSGRFFEVWQRPASALEPAPRIPLTSRWSPYAAPPCERVRALAARGDLRVAGGPAPKVVSLGQASYPGEWSTPGTADAPTPESDGSLTVAVRLERGGRYEIWLGGSVKAEVVTYVDGERAGSIANELVNSGAYLSLATLALEPGRHEVELRFAGSGLIPGDGGSTSPIGPLVLRRVGGERLDRVPAADAERLCGRDLDWIELADG